MSRLLASLYDRANARSEATVMGPRRRELLADASGVVLELGAGTGANLPHYPDTAQLVLTEPDRHMRRRLLDRPELDPARTEVLDAPAEQLPVAEASVDVVVSTLVLCSVEDPTAALAEVRRVLRPSGRLLLLEHVRAASPATARWQDRVTPLSRRLGGGCHLNRDTLATVRAAGFTTEEVIEHPVNKGLERLQPLILGSAFPSPSADERRVGSSHTTV